MTTKYVTLAASTAQTIEVSNGEPVLDPIADAPDRYLIPAFDELEVVNVDGDDIVYFTYGFAAGAEASASAGAIPAAPTIGGAGTTVVPAEPGEYVRIRATRECNIAVVRAISAGTPRIGVSALPRGGTRGDDPDNPGGTTHDYAPYGLDANADDPDTVILATSPFTYYLMDGAGALDVVSGNNGISSVGTVTYGVASLTSKNPGANCATRYTAGGSIRFPPPQTNLTDPTKPWALCMVLQIDAWDSGVGGSGPFSFMNWSGNSPPKMAHVVESPGNLLSWTDSTFSDLGTFVRSRDPLFPIGEPHVLIVNTLAGAGGTASSQATIEFWVDGVLVLTGGTDNSGSVGQWFEIGRNTGAGANFFGAIDMTFSNLATWARALTAAEIKSITEALADAAIFATSWTP